MSFKTNTLIEMCELIADCPHSTPKWTENGYIVIRNQNITTDGFLDLTTPSYTDYDDFQKRIKRAKPQLGDIVFTREAPMGLVCQIPKNIECCLGQRQVLLRPKKVIDGDYLFWALQSFYVQHQISWNEGTGTTVSNVRIPFLENLNIPRFDTVSEKKIGSIFKCIHDKIALNTQINQTLEAMAQALFKSWFVNFDPVKAKMEARANGGDDNAVRRAAMEVISGKSADELQLFEQKNPEAFAKLAETADLFPERLVESELGEIPEGWEVGKLSDLIEFNPKRTLKQGTVAPYLDMKNVPTSGHLADEVILREMSSGTKFINGDTLLARITPCLENGKTAYVDFLNENEVAWGSTEYIVMRPVKGIPTSFGYFIARNEAFRIFAIQTMTGTSGRQRANPAALADLPWLKYNKSVLLQFGLMADKFLSLAKSHGEENKAISQTRDALLPKLLSGEIDLSPFGIKEGSR